MNRFKDKYRIDSARYKNWDYSWAGSYFITICTKNRKHFFGKIINANMELSEIGKIVQREWEKTEIIRKDMNLGVGEYCIMPNHFHGIILLGENQYNHDRRYAMCCVSSTEKQKSENRDAMCCVSTEYKNEFGPQRKNISSVIRGFKSAVTIQAKKINPDFGWQSRFYDHIIRNEMEYRKIASYILYNPQKWENDTFHE